MSKEYLEAFKNLKQELYYSPNQIPDIDKWHETIEQALERLEAIDNANSNEALKCLEYIGEACYIEAGDAEEDCTLYAKNYIGYDTIKNYILKAQEDKKLLKVIDEKNVDILDIRKSKTVDDYNTAISYSNLNRKELIQEEFDTLKEWSKDEEEK